MKLSFCVVNTNGREIAPGMPRCDRADSAGRHGARGAGAGQLLRRRLGGGGRGQRARRQADRARPACRQGRERLHAAAQRPGRALPPAQRGLGAAGGGAGRARRLPWTRRRRRRWPEPSCCRAEGEPRPARGGSRAWTLRWPGFCSCTGCTRSRAADAARGEWAGRSPARCWCAGKQPSRWATSTPTSSSTPTRPTSASDSATPDGTCCTCRRARAIHHDQLTTDPRGARRRIVEFHRNRDRYMRKHHSDATRLLVRALERPLLPRPRARRRRGPGPRSQALSPPRAAGVGSQSRRWDPRGGRGVQPAAANRSLTDRDVH